MGKLLNILQGAGNAMDLPGSMVRDTLAMQNPFDQLATPFSNQNRYTGRDLLRRYGMAGEEDTWGNFGAGMAAEMALDPLNLIGGAGLLSKILKGARVRKFNKALRGLQKADNINVRNVISEPITGAADKARYVGRVADDGPALGYRGMRGDEFTTIVEPQGWKRDPVDYWHSEGNFTVPAERAGGTARTTMFGQDPAELLGPKDYDVLVGADISGLPFSTLRQPVAGKLEADLGLGIGVSGPIPRDRIRGAWVKNRGQWEPWDEKWTELPVATMPNLWQDAAAPKTGRLLSTLLGYNASRGLLNERLNQGQPQ
jgi:hypothetical protein